MPKVFPMTFSQRVVNGASHCTCTDAGQLQAIENEFWRYLRYNADVRPVHECWDNPCNEGVRLFCGNRHSKIEGPPAQAIRGVAHLQRHARPSRIGRQIEVQESCVLMTARPVRDHEMAMCTVPLKVCANASYHDFAILRL